METVVASTPKSEQTATPQKWGQDVMLFTMEEMASQCQETGRHLIEQAEQSIHDEPAEQFSDDCRTLHETVIDVKKLATFRHDERMASLARQLQNSLEVVYLTLEALRNHVERADDQDAVAAAAIPAKHKDVVVLSSRDNPLEAAVAVQEMLISSMLKQADAEVEAEVEVKKPRVEVEEKEAAKPEAGVTA